MARRGIAAAIALRDRVTEAGPLDHEERAIIRQGLDGHYRRALDEPLPLLGCRSRRAAVKTPKGRENVAAWLKLLENATAHRPPGDVMGAYDLGWMWRELGVEALHH